MPSASSILLRHLISALLLGLVATPAAAQSVRTTMLNPVAEQYTLGGFRYSPPPLVGWYEISSDPEQIVLVYSEQLDDERINTRGQVVARAYAIEDPSRVEDTEAWAATNRESQIEARGERLQSSSPLERVPGDQAIYTYQLASEMPQQAVALYERFYVTVSPDRDEYFVLLFLSQEDDFAEQPYFQQFYGSLASVEPVAASDEPASAEEVPGETAPASAVGSDTKTEQP